MIKKFGFLYIHLVWNTERQTRFLRLQPAFKDFWPF
jgi:hypothetical protein